MEKQGVFITNDTIRFERKLNGSIEKVWSYLTESDKRGKWLATGEMEMFEGGKVSLHFFHQDLSPIAGSPPEKYRDMASGHSFTGKVLKINPPYLLSFTWEDQSEVTFELQKAGDMVLLILTHRKLAENKDVQISVASGWHTHLDILIACLQGEISPNFWNRYDQMKKLYSPVAETGMLIRKPVEQTFEAFIDPEMTTKFWFTRSTGRLEKDKDVEWTWDMYNVVSYVSVKDIVPNRKIEIEWGGKGEDRTRVEWTFEPMNENSTFVNIIMDGFSGDPESILQKVSGSVGGFCLVLAGLKAYLEFNIQLNLVADRFPKGK